MRAIWAVPVIVSILLLVPVGALNAFAVHDNAAEHDNAVLTDNFQCARAEVTITIQDDEQHIVELIGPITVVVRFEGTSFGVAFDDDENRLDDVLTEIVAMRLEGGTDSVFGQLLLTQSSSFQSTGFLEEDVDNQFSFLDVPPFNDDGFTATSSFDLFFDFEIVASPVGPLHNGPNDPMLLEGQITHITPRADDALVANNIVPLLFEGSNNNARLSIGPVVLILNPNCFPPAFDVGPMQPHNTVFPATVGVPIAPLPISCSDQQKDGIDNFVNLGNLGLPAGAGVTGPGSGIGTVTQTFSYTPISPGIQIVTFTCTDIDGTSVIHVYNFDIRTAPPGPPVGGTFVPIDQSALLLAGVQSISMWMIPVIIAGIGIGVFVIKRRK